MIAASQDSVSQLEVVEHCIYRFVAKGVPNCLAYGYRKPNEKATTFARLDNYFPNSLVTHITTAAWQELLNFIGQDAMVYLISNTSLFHAVKTCFMQYCGRIIM